MKKLAAGILGPQIHALELQRKIGRRRRDVQSDHIEPGQLRQQTSSQISGNSRHYYSWFCIAHLFGTVFRCLHCGFGRFDAGSGRPVSSEKYFSFNCEHAGRHRLAPRAGQRRDDRAGGALSTLAFSTLADR